MKILLAITFVFGVIHLLTWTPLFKRALNGILEIFSNKDLSKPQTIAINKIKQRLNNSFFYFSLIFQAWYWLFK